jgi:hypothetical protein
VKRLLDYDPATGLKTFHDFDEAADKTIISYEQDVEPILDRNKAAQNDARGPMGDMVHVASIPSSVQLKWLIEHGVDLTNKDHMPGVRRLLNSSEWRYLKVRNIII